MAGDPLRNILPPYQSATVTIAANSFVELHGDFEYFLAVSATGSVSIGFNDQGPQPLVVGLAIADLRPWNVRKIRLYDTSGAPNTVSYVNGAANVNFTSQQTLPANAATASQQTTGNATLASILTELQAMDACSVGTRSDFTSVADAVFLAANAARKSLMIYNEGAGTLYLLFAAGVASATNYSVAVAAGQFFVSTPCVYKGAIRGIMGAAGTARVTELT